MNKLLILGVVAWILGMLGGSQSAKASGETDLAHAIATAPTGIPLDQVFNTNIPGSSTRLLDTPTVPRSIAQITADTPNQVGALWSRTGTGSQQNQFDVTKDMEMGFWLYFGDRGADAGEGMAFVVQNSPQRDQALAAGGQSLGVWGLVPSTSSGQKSQIARTAIQNSWALEFDTHANTDTYNPVGYFDFAQATASGPHIAYSLPGNPDSYVWWTGVLNGKYIGNYGLQHWRANPLAHASDGQWHHLTMFWKKATNKLVYYYDDRDPVTNEQREIFNSDEFVVKPTELAQAGVNDPTQAIWGITGSTGPDRSSNQLVMVEHATSLGKVDATAHLDNETTHQEVTADTPVAAGQQLTYRYEFEYHPVADEQELQPLTMMLPMPEGFEMTVGKVTYDDHSTETIAQPADNQLKVTWHKGLNKERHHATVAITGRARPDKPGTWRPAAVAKFYGENYQTTLKTTRYQVEDGLWLQLTNLKDDTYVLKRSESASIKVRLQNGDEPLTPEQVAAYPLQVRLNQQEHPLSDFAGTLVANEAPGTYQLTVPAKMLTKDENTLTLQAKGASQSSNPLTISLIRSQGSLGFKQVSATASFAPRNLTGRQMLLQRNADWQLTVHDDRGAHKQWRLQVKMVDDFKTPSDLRLRGYPVWVTADSVHPLNREETTVMTRVSEADEEETAITQGWQPNTGLLFHVGADALVGEYHGQLQWTLENVI